MKTYSQIVLALAIGLFMGTKAEAQSVASENFNAITVGTEIGDVTGWFAGGTGPAVVSSGVAGTRGLGSHGNIFTWTAHPFSWTDPSFQKILMEMDFKTSTNGKFDDDRMGWMTSSSSTSSDLIFGVQMDPIDATPSILNIEGYWINTGTTKVYPSIVTLPTLSNSTWYRLRTEFTKMGGTSARIEVWLFLLDALGNPTAQIATGSIANTSDLGSNAPNSAYFPATSIYPAFKNHTSEPGETDNATVVVNPGSTITTLGTLTAFSAQPGEPSIAQTYSVFGRGLAGDIAINAPTGFELSTDGTTYSSSLTLTHASGSVPTTTIYVRLNSATVGTYNGDIAHASTGATTQNVAVSGDVAVSQTVSLVSSADAYISGSGTANNYGAQTYLRVSTASASTSRRGSLLKWNVGTIPSVATVMSVSLTVNVSTAASATCYLYNMRRGWLEGTGAGSATGDGATWLTYDGSSNWGTAGAASITTDRYNVNLWNAGSSTFSTTGSKTVQLNSDGIAAVQGWVDGSIDNNGVTIQNYVATTTADVQFSSNNHGTPANRPTLNITYTLPGPTIAVSGTLTSFTTQPGVPSTAQTYTVSGVSLTDNISITAPTGFELSTDGTTYSPGLTLTQSGGTVSSTTVYVRLYNASEGTFNGNIVHTSADATTQNLAVTGTVDNAVTLTFRNGAAGYNGADDAFIRDLTNSSTNYGSATGLEWDDNTDGTADEITLIRFNELFTSGGGPIPDGSTITSAVLSYKVSAAANAQGSSANVYESLVDWTGSTVTWDNFGGDAGVQSDEYDPSIVGTALATTQNTQYTLEVTASLQRWSNGTANRGWVFLSSSTDGVVIYSSDYATISDRPLLTLVYEPSTGPNIVTAGTLTAFSAQPGTPSEAQTYSVSGTNLTDNISITAPTGFELSTDGSTYSAGLTLFQSGGLVSSTSVYVRLSSATEGTFSGNIAHASSGATTRNVAANGTVLYVYTLTAGNDGHGTVTLNPTGGSYNNGTTVTLTPVSNSGYAFDAWTGPNAGEIVNTSGVYSIVMNGNKSVTATFVESQVLWTAYNDCVYRSSDQYIGTNVTTFGIGTDFTGSSAGVLLQQVSGTTTGITATLTQSGGVMWQADPASGGSDPNAGTDAYNTFHGIADMTGVIYYGSTGWYVDVTFTGLDPDKEYTFATSANRGDGAYLTRLSAYVIHGATSYTNASTAGVQAPAADSVIFCTGYNDENGYVARWTNIKPGTDGSFFVRARAGSAENKAYAFDVFMLQELGAPVLPPAAPTTLTATPTIGTQIDLAWTDNASNEEAFVIERSTNGGTTFSALGTVGANIVTYTDAGLAAGSSYDYRVRAANSGGNSDWSNAASAATPGNPNNALRFGADDAYVTFGDAAELKLAQFTLEAWFRKEGAGVQTSTGSGGVTTAIPLISKGSSGADSPANQNVNYFLGIDGTTNVVVADFEDNSAGTNHPVTGVTTVVEDTWYHVAVTFDGAKWQLFLNGDLERELAVSATPEATSIQTAALGTSFFGSTAQGFFDGTIDEARIWNYARTQAEIQSTLGLQVLTETGLVARWGLNEGTSTIAASSAGTTIDGTITGTGWSWVAGAPMTINHAPAQPVLVVPTSGSTGVPTSPTLQVSVTDAEAEAMTVTFYGRPKSTVAADFTVIALPDVQNYTSAASGGTMAMFNAQTNWIVAQQAARNIVFVAQEGDVTNYNSASEWSNASSAMGILESPEPGIPYGIAIGNHDAPGSSLLNNYFPPSRFSGRAYYGGCYATGDYAHNYELFSASGMGFIVIHLGGGDQTPATAVLDWADALLKTHSTRRAIVVHHSILNVGDPATFTTPGQNIYTALSDNPNLFLLLCGHNHGEGRKTDTGTNGNTIYSILSDYQNDTGGNGWLRVLTFSPVNDQITVESYSPYLLQSDWGADLFTLAYDMDGAASYTMLGTNTGVASGTTTSITWPSLTDLTEYEWYATVSDGHTTTTGATWSFTTGTESAPTDVITATQPNTDYASAETGVTLNFATLPAGGGEVTVTRHNSVPPDPPTYELPPGSADYLPVWLEITSTIPDHSFAVEVTLDLSGVAGFDANSAVMFYNETTDCWIPLAGAFTAGSPNTFTFTATHFTPFAFVAKPAPSYNLFVGNTSDATSAGVTAPNNTWRSGTPPAGGYNGEDDWSWTGSQSITFYLVPQTNTIFKAADIMLEWDNSIMTHASTAFTGIPFTTSSATLQASQDQLLIHVEGSVDITANSYIAAVTFTLLKPGHSPLVVIGSDFTKNPTLSVFVTPHQGEVKAYLGDFATTAGPDYTQGDGKLDITDLSPWSSSYWSGVQGGPGMTNYKAKYDIGPTSNGYVYTLPTLDSKIDFEDLVVFSISYGLSKQYQLPKAPVESKEPLMIASSATAGTGAETRIPVTVSGGVADLRAMSLVLSGRFGKFLGVEKGALLKPYSTPVMLLSRTEGSRVYVDMAIMGSDVEALNAEGEVLVLRFDGKSTVAVTKADCRTSANYAIATEIKDAPVAIPTSFGLSQNYPNPFNPSTVLEYQVPAPAQVEISIYNLLGEKVATLVNEVKEPGYHSITWNGTGANGQTVATGIYFYRMHAGDFVSTKRMLLVK